jgi:hypothetical protein
LKAALARLQAWWFSLPVVTRRFVEKTAWFAGTASGTVLWEAVHNGHLWEKHTWALAGGAGWAVVRAVARQMPREAWTASERERKEDDSK